MSPHQRALTCPGFVRKSRPIRSGRTGVAGSGIVVVRHRLGVRPAAAGGAHQPGDPLPRMRMALVATALAAMGPAAGAPAARVPVAVAGGLAGGVGHRIAWAGHERDAFVFDALQSYLHAVELDHAVTSAIYVRQSSALPLTRLIAGATMRMPRGTAQRRCA
jgi:hypothetical protein